MGNPKKSKTPNQKPKSPKKKKKDKTKTSNVEQQKTMSSGFYPHGEKNPHPEEEITFEPEKPSTVIVPDPKPPTDPPTPFVQPRTDDDDGGGKVGPVADYLGKQQEPPFTVFTGYKNKNKTPRSSPTNS